MSGEALDYDLFESFCQKLHIPLENLYGPTEAAVDVSHWRCHANPQRRVSIGSAISGVELYVLNDQMEEVAPGELGELHIGGVAVGRGYLRDAELTARCFVPAPFGTRALLYKTGDLARREADGNILFCGRRDGQVKLNGLRIELGEIEQAIRAHPAVTDAMVALERTGADAQLVAYVVLRDAEQGFDKGSLLRFLRQRLLAHSIPHVWHTVPVIPLSAHGKRQRPSLSSGSVSLRQLEQDPASSAYTNGKGSGSERAALDTSRGIS